MIRMKPFAELCIRRFQRVAAVFAEFVCSFSINLPEELLSPSLQACMLSKKA